MGILAAGATLVAIAAHWLSSSRSPGTNSRMTPEAAEAAARAYLALEAREQEVDRTLWAPEISAERYEDEINRLWDALNAATHRWEILAAYPILEYRIPELAAPTSRPHGISRRIQASGHPRVWDSPSWRAWCREMAQGGWTLEGTHWALVGHRGRTNASPAESTVRLSARLLNAAQDRRVSLQAVVLIDWAPEESPTPMATSATVVSVELLDRTGPAPFLRWFGVDLPEGGGVFNDPLLVRDLNGDGRPEILLVGAGELWVNRTGETNADAPFRRETAGTLPRERIQAAVCADADGDGLEDLILAGREGVRWIRGTGRTPWGQTQVGWRSPSVLKHPQALTAGDVDGDGDLDLWLVQYKLPYQQGQFPTPWFDARDGFPSYLLLNDGHGQFQDGTDASGLSRIRHRRGYSASFVDLDLDGNLDLVQVSDFAGVDVLLNDGRGHFREGADVLGPESRAFGMSHCIADANGDGVPDLLMLGMGSTVAERLVMLGLERRVSGEQAGTVGAMIRGNRLYFGTRRAGAPLRPAREPIGEGIRQTGWTWGAAWEDFDNDGWLDLAVANGHETRASTSDYERQFWLHDRFVAGSENNPAAEFYFRTAAGRRLAAAASYGGWQDNQLRLGSPAGESPDVAWLLGFAEPADSRNLVAADLDLDGRLDLVVTTQEGWPAPRQRLLVYRNQVDAGDWAGILLDGMPTGTRVELDPGERAYSRWILTGDGFRSQGPAAVHFGLGHAPVSRARIFRPGRKEVDLKSPLTGRWTVYPDPKAGQE
ncbi:MAG: CRTAC1 family protein [Verrucomicrobiales bacterium]|nr:CRTAC1 family protein [Verrucomicrobiales bacterium]